MAPDDAAGRPSLEMTAGANLASPSRAQGRRRYAKFIAFIVVIAALAAGVGNWVIGQINYVHIVDARIDGDVKTISTRLSGFVTELNVSEGDRVKRGDVLVRIDDREGRLQLLELDYAVEGTEAQLGQTRARIEMLDRTTASGIAARRSDLVAARAEVSVRQSKLKLAQDEFTRADSLKARGVVSTQRWQSLQTGVETVRQELAKARAQVEAAAAALVSAQVARSEMEVLRHDLTRLGAQRELTIAQRQRKQIDIDDMRVLSPVDAIIDKTFVSSGEMAQAGQRLLLLHDPDRVWIEANVRETKVRNLRLGQAVAIRVDAYPNHKFVGTLERIGDVTTSQFALLPAPNPSGNFTKVTQRVPIRIAVDQTEGLLRPGMMVELDIDIDVGVR
ncbi:MAG: membrane fusion protein (multidrug efflux system) [Alphaproteobacteria bacterium]|jgi:membrane fusion protein (multidrug efflux system)